MKRINEFLKGMEKMSDKKIKRDAADEAAQAQCECGCECENTGGCADGCGCDTDSCGGAQEQEDEVMRLTKEREELVALAQRIQADFENFRRRNASIRKDSYDEGMQDAMKAMLPVVDNFERMVKAADGASDALKDGLEMVLKQMLEAMEKLGVTVIAALGEPFDPNFHEAVMQEDAGGENAGIIIEVFQTGYQMKERVLRASMVKVGA